MPRTRYILTVCEPEDNWDARRHTFYVELGCDLTQLKPVLQKRWVRKLVESEWGAPVKNPTQKRAWYETFFEKTEMEADKNCWAVTICQPSPGSENQWLNF